MADENVPLWAVRLRAERVARQWSKPAMARALYKAADLGPNRTQVESLARQIRGYERGEHFPRDWASAYAKAFETTTDGLFGGVDVGVDNEDVDRRALLGLVATAATTTALARDAEPLRDAFEAAVAADATDRDADAWEGVADDYAREVGWVSPTVLHPELSTDFAELTRLLPSARGTARSRVIHVAAQLAALIAISPTTMGEGRAARRWWRTAARAADQTGDHRAAALVRGRAAVFSLYADLPRLSIVEQAEEAMRSVAAFRAPALRPGTPLAPKPSANSAATRKPPPPSTIFAASSSNSPTRSPICAATSGAGHGVAFISSPALSIRVPGTSAKRRRRRTPRSPCTRPGAGRVAGRSRCTVPG